MRNFYILQPIYMATYSGVYREMIRQIFINSSREILINGDYTCDLTKEGNNGYKYNSEKKYFENNRGNIFYTNQKDANKAHTILKKQKISELKIKKASIEKQIQEIKK